VLTALGREPSGEIVEEDARAYVGAMLIVEAFAELRNIRRLLTAPTPKG
jgi:hypothetical protein